MSVKRNACETRTDDQELGIRMMRQAILLARRGQGWVEPNPMVGCVLVREDRVIGEGFHRRFGGPHAEVNALTACRKSARGATAYVTLEPCNHHGKTPPCCDALIQAKVARVVIGVRDPSSHGRGKGVRRLRTAGIEVQVGVCRDEALRLIAPFRTRIHSARPYVIAKWAQTLDGCLATASGESRWISCETSRRQVHRMRACVDAVMVGVGTVLADDPMLTARDVRVRRVASRIVLDSRLRIPQSSRLIQSIDVAPTIIFTAPARSKSAKARSLTRRGVTIIACRLRGKSLDLSDALANPVLRDVTNVLVEGGPTLLTSLFAAQLIDEAIVYVAPAVFGGGQARVIFPDQVRPGSIQWQRSGQDIRGNVYMR